MIIIVGCRMWPKFNSWMRLFIFHIVLTPLGNLTALPPALAS